MKRWFLFLFSVLPAASLSAGQTFCTDRPKPGRTVFVFGSDIHKKFIRHTARLTGKPHPEVCPVPTASADNGKNVKYWESVCRWLYAGQDTGGFTSLEAERSFREKAAGHLEKVRTAQE